MSEETHVLINIPSQKYDAEEHKEKPPTTPVDVETYHRRNLNSQLLDALFKDDIHEIRRLLEAGASGDATCVSEGEVCMTGLEVGAWLSSEEAVKALLEASTLSIKGRQGTTAAHLAAWRGDLPILQLLPHLADPIQPSSQQPPPHAWDSLAHNHSELTDIIPESFCKGSTPLHLASQRGHLDCVKYLLTQVKNAEVRNSRQLSALDVVGQYCVNENAEYKLIEIVKTLLDNGAEFTKSGRQEVTALHTAVSKNMTKLTEFLVESGASGQVVNERGFSPGHLAVELTALGPLRAIVNKAPELTETRGRRGRTLLARAVERGWRSGVNFLIAAGADITTLTPKQQNLLHLAALNGHSEILMELLNLFGAKNKNLEKEDEDGNTPVCLSVQRDYAKCVKILESYGANSKIILPSGRSLVEEAAYWNAPDVLDHLLSKEGTQLGLALHKAAELGHSKCVSVILKRYPSAVRAKDYRGWYPLHVAAFNVRPECVRVMLEHGADLSDTVELEYEQRSRFSFTNSIYLSGFEFIVCCIPMPGQFLEDIFDKFIEKHSPTNGPFEVSMHCDILDPKNNEKTEQMKVLSVLLLSGKERLEQRLLLHPIVVTFLYLKWQSMKVFFYFVLFLYLTFAIFFTVQAILYSLELVGQPTSYVLNIITSICTLMMIIAELASVTRKFFIKDWEFYCKLGIIVCTIIALVFMYSHSMYARYPSALAVLLSWIEVLFLQARFPNGGYYVLMFTKVTNKVFRALKMFSCIVIGFTFAFMVLFQSTEPFPNIWKSLIKVVIMMEEMDFAGTIEDPVEEDASHKALLFSIFGRILFLAFEILVVVVLMNVIVGLAVSDVSVLEREGRAMRLAKMITSLSSLERIVYNHVFLACLPESIRKFIERRRCVTTWIIRGNRNLPTSAFPQLPHDIQEYVNLKVYSNDERPWEVIDGPKEVVTNQTVIDIS